MNYNLTVERQLPGAFLFSASYVGLQGRKLTNAVELNPAGNESGNAICAAIAGCNSFNNFAVAPQSFRYPQVNTNGLLIFGSLGQFGTFVNSNYNALQVVVDKKTSHGLNFRAAYGWSHSLDGSSSFEDLGFSGIRGLDPFNSRVNYGDSAYDARQRLVISYDYELPSVRRFNSLQSLPSRLTDGWRISGITTFQTGIPVSVGDGGTFRSYTCNISFEFFSCWDRPDVVAPVKTGDPRTYQVNNSMNGTRKPVGTRGNYWFDPNSFQREPLGTLGNTGRNFFHGPGINNWGAPRNTREHRAELLSWARHQQLGLRAV
jgi:hypothetical protein